MNRELMEKWRAEADSIRAKAKAEKREFTGIEKTRLKHLDADIRQTFDKLKAGEAFAEARVVNEPAPGTGNASVNHALQVVDGQGAKLGQLSKAEIEIFGEAKLDASVMRQVREGFNRYLRTGDTTYMEKLKNRDNFVITTGTASGGWVPTSLTVPAIVQRAWNFVFLALALTGYNALETSESDNVNVPVMDDSAVSGDTPAEDASADTAADPSATTLALPPTLYSSKSVWLSNTILGAQTYDLVAYLMPLLEKRVALSQDSAWTTELTGLNASGNRVVTASALGITFDEALAFYHKLPPVYRSDAVWVLSDTLLQCYESLKDSQGRPIMVMDPQASGVRTIFGRPVVVGNNMQAVAANAIAGAFVSGEAIKCRLCPPRVARYTNIPTFPDQVGFRMFQNASAKFVGAGCAFLKMGAS